MRTHPVTAAAATTNTNETVDGTVTLQAERERREKERERDDRKADDALKELRRLELEAEKREIRQSRAERILQVRMIQGG